MVLVKTKVKTLNFLKMYLVINDCYVKHLLIAS